jgi:nitronate monooxygenase
VAAVCEASALGFIGAAYLSPAQIVEAGKAVKVRTGRRFGINLFAPQPLPSMPPPPRGSVLDRVSDARKRAHIISAR